MRLRRILQATAWTCPDIGYVLCVVRAAFFVFRVARRVLRVACCVLRVACRVLGEQSTPRLRVGAFKADGIELTATNRLLDGASYVQLERMESN